MNKKHPNPRTGSRSRRRLAAVAITAASLTGSAGLLAACGGSSTTSSASSASTVASTDASVVAGNDQVLPVDANPITNTSTNQAFTIDQVLVENNVDSAGKAVDDHLEITVTNTSSTDLTGFEVYYTFDDPTAGVTENYYAKLPTDLTVAAGATGTIHFDNSGAADHFPVNDYSLYYTSTNALDVKVEVSATDAAPQTFTVQKDAGGSETAD